RRRRAARRRHRLRVRRLRRGLRFAARVPAGRGGRRLVRDHLELRDLGLVDDVGVVPVLAGRAVLLALVRFALGDLRLVAVARRRLGVVPSVGGLGRPRLVVDVVGVVGDELRVGIVFLVGLGVLANGD